MSVQYAKRILKYKLIEFLLNLQVSHPLHHEKTGFQINFLFYSIFGFGN